MAVKDKKPSIRFNEFTDAWEQRKLGKIAAFSKGRGYSKNDLTEVGTPIILYGRLYTKYQTMISEVDTFAVDKPGSVYSSGNEVIVPSSGETAEDIARASVVEKSGVLLGGDLNIIHPNNDVDSAFLALSVSNGEQQKLLAKKAQGKSVVHLHNADLQEVELSYPSKQEQVEISRLFRDLDNLITLHQRKHDKMVIVKKSMLEKMFPKDVANVPEIRFAGFADAWEQRKLSELITPVVREVPKPTEPYEKISVRSHAKGTFHQKIENPDSVAMDKLFVVRENDLIVNITFAWEHAIAVATKEDDGLLVSHRFPTYTMSNSDVGFMKYVVSRENFRRKMELISPGGAGRNRVLDKKDFMNIEVIAPIEIDEQNRIGTFFKHLDKLITLHRRELEKLKNINKSMLEKMFV